MRMHRVISKRCGWVVNFFVDALNTCHYEFCARFPLFSVSRCVVVKSKVKPTKLPASWLGTRDRTLFTFTSRKLKLMNIKGSL